jgi:hypothetical protein
MNSDRVTYHYAFLRVVPHVHLGAYANIGVILYARTAEYLGMRVLSERDALLRLAKDLDVDLLLSYLESYSRICAGEARAGPVALLPPSERFHWLTAPRSDVLQCSAVHEGLCDDPAAALEELFTGYVRQAL